MSMSAKMLPIAKCFKLLQIHFILKTIFYEWVTDLPVLRCPYYYYYEVVGSSSGVGINVNIHGNATCPRDNKMQKAIHKLQKEKLERFIRLEFI